MQRYQAMLRTPFAVLGISTRDDLLSGIDFLPWDSPTRAPQDPVAEAACRQLMAYLRAPDFTFDLPLHLCGTPFQTRVWRALREIPAGSTVHYGDLARALGSGPRAVGQACGANPLPIVVPCHRVLAKNGMGGFMHHSSGEPLSIKAWLLRHERFQQ